MPTLNYFLLTSLLTIITTFHITSINIKDEKSIHISEAELEIHNAHSQNKNKLKFIYDLHEEEDYKEIMKDIDLVENFSCNLSESSLICIIFRAQIKKLDVNNLTDNTSTYTLLIKSNFNNSMIKAEFRVDSDKEHFENELFKIFETD
jgi:hypothetical protein